MSRFFKQFKAKALQKRYEALLKDAMTAQRNGDIRQYSELSKQADELYQKIQSASQVTQ